MELAGMLGTTRVHNTMFSQLIAACYGSSWGLHVYIPVCLQQELRLNRGKK